MPTSATTRATCIACLRIDSLRAEPRQQQEGHAEERRDEGGDARAPGAQIAHDAEHCQNESYQSRRCRHRRVSARQCMPIRAPRVDHRAGFALPGRDMLSPMKIALVQQHATRDKAANVQRGLAALDQAAAAGAKVVCFAELAFEWFYPQKPAGSERAQPGRAARRSAP